MKARRRAVVVTALVATAMLLPVSSAHAAVTARVDSPTAGQVLRDAVPLRVTTTYGFGDSRPSWAEARLVLPSGQMAPGTDVVRLDCVSGCGFGGGSTGTWSGPDFAPWTLHPFASSSMPSCNGAYGVQARAEGTSWVSGNGVIISLPPNSPWGVNVTTRTNEATVTWRAPEHPDLTGFTVEQRRSATGQWDTVAEVGPDTTSLTRSGLAGGPIEFRVQALRGDGFTASGAPAAPCSDTGRDLSSAWSEAASGTVPTPRPARTPSPSPSPGATDGTTPPDDGATDPDDGSTEPVDGSTDSPDDSTEPAEDTTEPESDASPSPRPRIGSASRAAPPRVESQERRDVTAPEVSQPEGEDRYFGDDMEFSEELDFGAPPPDDMDREPGTVTIQVPGGLQSVLGSELDLDRVLVPVAGGMILLSLGLHLRRWTRLGLE